MNVILDKIPVQNNKIIGAFNDDETMYAYQSDKVVQTLQLED